MTQELSAFASTSPTGGETCPVCLRRLKNSRLGKPENCDHYFCFTCIQEWAKNVNTCPVDRIQFNYIEVYSNIHGKLLNKVHIPNINVIESSTDPNDVTYCEICHQCDREESLLLCDGCDKGYHLSCLSPPLSEIPEGDWYCLNCLPIIYEQYDPSLILESDIDDNHSNLNTHSDNESPMNVVDSDSDDDDSSGVELRPGRSRSLFQNGHQSPVVMIEDSSESSEDEKRSVNQDSDEESSEDSDGFRRRCTNYNKVVILSSTEGSESCSDIDVISIGESSSRSQVESHSHSNSRMELEVGSSSSGEEIDLEEDIQPIGSMIRRCNSSQRIESDSNSNENSHSRESSSTTTANKDETDNSESKDTMWRNMTVPLTRLKWKIPRKVSVGDNTSSDLTNPDDATSNSRQTSITGSHYVSSGTDKESVYSGAGVKLEPGMGMRQGRDQDRSVYSNVDILDDITMTPLPNTSSHPNINDINVAESIPTCASVGDCSITKSDKSQPTTKDKSGSSSSSHTFSDRTNKSVQKRRRSKRNKQKAQLSNCSNSKKPEMWFDFRGIESHLPPTRRRSSNTPRQPAHTQPHSGLVGGEALQSAYNSFGQPLIRVRSSSGDPPRMPFLPTTQMNFAPCNYGQGHPPYPYPRGQLHMLHQPPPQQPPFVYVSGPQAPFMHMSGPPPQHPPFIHVSGSPPQPPWRRNFEFSNDTRTAYGSGVPNFSTYQYQRPSDEKREPKRTQKRRRKRKSKVVLTPAKKSSQKSEEPVSIEVLHKRACRRRRKKRKREEWRLRRDAAKKAGQQLRKTPPNKKRKVMISPAGINDPTYSPSKWNPKDVVQSDGCMTRARTAATNTPRKQAMREAVREAYRHVDHEEGLMFARKILAKQGRMDDGSTSSHKPATMENGMGNGDGCLTTPTKVGSRSDRPTITTPLSGYVKKSPRKIITEGQYQYQVASIPETPPSTMSSQHRNRTRLVSGSDITGTTSSSRYQEREQEICERIMDEVKRRTVPSRRTLSSVLVTPIQKTMVTKSVNSEVLDEPVKPVGSRGRAGSSDLINRLCQNMDDLQRRNNVIQKDGSITPIKEDTSPPLPLDPLLSLSSSSIAMASPTTPSPRMTSSSSPATTPQRYTTTRSHDHPTRPTYPTNQNQLHIAKPVSSRRSERSQTPQNSGRGNFSTLLDKGCDDHCDGEANDLKQPNSSYSSVTKGCRDASRSRVAKRLLSSDSEPRRENGLPDYVTFVPNTPTSSADAHPFYSATQCLSTTSVSSNSSTASSNSTGMDRSLSSTGSSDTSTTSRNSDTASSDSSAGDPKLYVKRLLKQHYHLGNITSYQFSRILERASRKVEQGQLNSNCTDKQRIRRLVDEYVHAYTNANPE